MNHTMRRILSQLDPLRIGNVVEGGPSGTGIVFGGRFKQFLSTNDANVHSIVFQLVIFIGERPAKVNTNDI